MINNFIVRAFPEKNMLKICMDGYFLKSELELALHLANSESRKLREGFDVIIDLRNLVTPTNVLGINFSKLRRILGILGASSFHFAGIDHVSNQSSHENVGFYPDENEWNLR